MKTSKLLLVLLLSILVIISFACQDKPAEKKQEQSEEGEESGTKLALNETYDTVRNGARLILAYDAQSNSFVGTVENTTDKTLKNVRVEVHQSNGKEIGPTTPGDLESGEKRDVKLTATSTDFDGWNAHPEVGSGEHGHGEERGEHDKEGEHEHGHGEHNHEHGEHKHEQNEHK
jgi:hypothetical protein